MRKIALTLLFTLILPLTASAEVVSFSDLTEGHTNYEAVMGLVENGTINGYADGTFKPSNPINRAEFMKIVVGAIGAETSGSFYKNCFPDVKEEWFAPYVCYGKSFDIIEGYPDGNFKPENNINYAEALKMVYEAYGLEGKENPTSEDWYATYLEDVRSEGLGIGATAGKTLTRGDVAQLVWNLLNGKLNLTKELTEEEANYVNEEYGFSLDFVDSWAGYKADTEAVEDSDTRVAEIKFSLPDTWEAAFPHGSTFSNNLFTIAVRPLSYNDQFAECDSDDAPANCVLQDFVIGESDDYVYTWATSWSTSSPHDLFDKPLADLETVIDSFELVSE